jgi:hypothetical protein
MREAYYNIPLELDIIKMYINEALQANIYLMSLLFRIVRNKQIFVVITFQPLGMPKDFGMD